MFVKNLALAGLFDQYAAFVACESGVFHRSSDCGAGRFVSADCNGTGMASGVAGAADFVGRASDFPACVWRGDVG